MPYIIRENTVQANNRKDPGIQDVYHATNVYVNRALVALWEAPNAGPSALFQAPVPADPPQTIDQTTAKYMSYSTVQSQRNPTAVQNVDGGEKGQQVNHSEGEIPVKPLKPGEAPTLQDPGDTQSQTAPSPVTVPNGETVLGRMENFLNKCLDEAAGGAWKRQGSPNVLNSPRNPNIINCFETLGFGPNFYDKNAPYGDQIPWCAAFVGTTLKMSGAPYVKGGNALRAAAYNGYGQSLGKNNYDSWRRNDVMVVNFGSSFHVCFIRGVDVKGNKFQMCGGNQSSNMTQTNVSGLDKIVYVGRNWTVDPAFDKSIVGTLTAATPRVNTR